VYKNITIWSFILQIKKIRILNKCIFISSNTCIKMVIAPPLIQNSFNLQTFDFKLIILFLEHYRESRTIQSKQNPAILTHNSTSSTDESASGAHFRRAPSDVIDIRILRLLDSEIVCSTSCSIISTSDDDPSSNAGVILPQLPFSGLHTRGRNFHELHFQVPIHHHFIIIFLARKRGESHRVSLRQVGVFETNVQRARLVPVDQGETASVVGYGWPDEVFLVALKRVAVCVHHVAVGLGQCWCGREKPHRKREQSEQLHGHG